MDGLGSVRFGFTGEITGDVVIVQSGWHADITDDAVACCKERLDKVGIKVVGHLKVPGALELPLAAEWACSYYPEIKAIIAFGIILKGETDHYNVVRDNCYAGLARLSTEESMPIINQVLAVHDIADAKHRCDPTRADNKGYAAADACTQMIKLKDELEAKFD